MKTPIYVLLLFWLISCSDPDNDPIVSKIEATKNGDEWKGRTEIHFDVETDTLMILGIANESEEFIVMKIKFVGTGNYTLNSNQALYYSTIGGDVLTSEYKIDSDGFGEIEVLAYDPDSDAISGHFEIKLKKDRSVFEDAVEYLHFTNGSFSGMSSQ